MEAAAVAPAERETSAEWGDGVVALGFRVKASSRESPSQKAGNVLEADLRSHWSTATNTKEWILLELQEPCLLSHVRIYNKSVLEWELTAGLRYKPEAFIKVRQRCEAPKRDVVYPANHTPCRYLRISCLRGNPIAIFFIQLYGIPVPGLEPELQPLLTHLLPQITSAKQPPSHNMHLQADLNSVTETSESSVRFLALLSGPFYPILHLVNERDPTKSLFSSADSDAQRTNPAAIPTGNVEDEGYCIATVYNAQPRRSRSPSYAQPASYLLAFRAETAMLLLRKAHKDKTLGVVCLRKAFFMYYMRLLRSLRYVASLLKLLQTFGLSYHLSKHYFQVDLAVELLEDLLGIIQPNLERLEKIERIHSELMQGNASSVTKKLHLKDLDRKAISDLENKRDRTVIDLLLQAARFDCEYQEKIPEGEHYPNIAGDAKLSVEISTEALEFADAITLLTSLLSIYMDELSLVDGVATQKVRSAKVKPLISYFLRKGTDDTKVLGHITEGSNFESLCFEELFEIVRCGKDSEDTYADKIQVIKEVLSGSASQAVNPDCKSIRESILQVMSSLSSVEAYFEFFSARSAQEYGELEEAEIELELIEKEKSVHNFIGHRHDDLVPDMTSYHKDGNDVNKRLQEVRENIRSLERSRLKEEITARRQKKLLIRHAREKHLEETSSREMELMQELDRERALEMEREVERQRQLDTERAKSRELQFNLDLEKEKQTQRELQRELEQVELGRSSRREFSTNPNSRSRERYRERDGGRAQQEVGSLRSSSRGHEGGSAQASAAAGGPAVVLAGSRTFSGGNLPTILQPRERAATDDDYAWTEGSRDSGDASSIGDPEFDGPRSHVARGGGGKSSSRQLVERRERDGTAAGTGRREGKWERKQHS
nr:unnamed protein product [Digitaria exilis]